MPGSRLHAAVQATLGTTTTADSSTDTHKRSLPNSETPQQGNAAVEEGGAAADSKPEDGSDGPPDPKRLKV
eukprot:g74971.t1